MLVLHAIMLNLKNVFRIKLLNEHDDEDVKIFPWTFT